MERHGRIESLRERVARERQMRAVEEEAAEKALFNEILRLSNAARAEATRYGISCSHNYLFSEHCSIEHVWRERIDNEKHIESQRIIDDAIEKIEELRLRSKYENMRRFGLRERRHLFGASSKLWELYIKIMIDHNAAEDRLEKTRRREKRKAFWRAVFCLT
jgi:hypothetical protein